MSLRESCLAGDRPAPRGRGEAGACEGGCIGPFTNQGSRRGDVGMSFGDCMECGRRVMIPTSTRGFESLGQVVEAYLPPVADPS